MTTKIVKYDDKPVTAAGSPVLTSEEGSGQEVVTMGQLMQLLADTQKNMQELQALYSSFNVAKVTDATTGATTYQTFQQMQGDKLIAAAQKASQDFLNALEQQEKQQKKSKILKGFGLAFMMVVAVAVAVGSGGAASPMLMLALTTATTAMAAAGTQDPFQMASGALAGVLAKAGLNDKAAHLVADIMITAAMTAVAGGVSAGASAAANAGKLTSTALMQVAGAAGEMQTQMLLETGGVSDTALAIANATGMDPNSTGFKVLEICLTIAVIARGIGFGYMATNSASSSSNVLKFFEKFTDNPAKVRTMLNLIQTGSTIAEAGFNAGAGATLIQAAKEGYGASMAEASATEYDSETQSVNLYGKILEDMLSSLVADLGGQMTSMSENIDVGFAQKI